jgi:hypothetical protein
MCKKLLESGLYWRELRKSEMGQTGQQGRVGVIQGGGTTVVTLRGGARVHGAPTTPSPAGVASPMTVIRGDPSRLASPPSAISTSSGGGGGGHQRTGSLGMTPQRPASATPPITPAAPGTGIPTSSSAHVLKTPPTSRS